MRRDGIGSFLFALKEVDSQLLFFSLRSESGEEKLL